MVPFRSNRFLPRNESGRTNTTISGALALLFLALLLLGARESFGQPSGEPGSMAPTTTLAPIGSDALWQRINALTVEANRPNRQGYTRDLFPQWLDLDGDGCNARNQTLRDESLTKAVLRNRCTIEMGKWRSPYDGIIATDPTALDIDHVVPLANAWQSGAYTWNDEDRTRYANDTTHPDHLVAVTRESNRSKGDQSPDQWLPPSRDAWCDYATAWVDIKTRWALTATPREIDALRALARTCTR